MNQKFSRRTTLPSRQNQAGYVLLLGVVFILIMTVFGLYAMNGSILQLRMSGNYRDAKVASEASEMALRWGESYLQSRSPLNRPFPCQTLTVNNSLQNCNNARQVLEANLITYDVEDLDAWGNNDTWNNARDYGIDPDTSAATTPTFTIAGVSRQPRFLLEQSFVDRDDLAGRPQQGRVFYRVIAAANGARTSTLSVLESRVAKRFE